MEWVAKTSLNDPFPQTAALDRRKSSVGSPPPNFTRFTLNLRSHVQMARSGISLAKVNDWSGARSGRRDGCLQSGRIQTVRFWSNCSES